MGSTPYYAPDLNLLDFFGLVDREVAHARHDHGLHTFIGGSAEAQSAFDAEMRDYFFARAPEWTILTVYTRRGEEQQVAEAFSETPRGDRWAPRIATTARPRWNRCLLTFGTELGPHAHRSGRVK